jgi:hypothetical protein
MFKNMIIHPGMIVGFFAFCKIRGGRHEYDEKCQNSQKHAAYEAGEEACPFLLLPFAGARSGCCILLFSYVGYSHCIQGL